MLKVCQDVFIPKMEKIFNTIIATSAYPNILRIYFYFMCPLSYYRYWLRFWKKNIA